MYTYARGRDTVCDGWDREFNGARTHMEGTEALSLSRIGHVAESMAVMSCLARSGAALGIHPLGPPQVALPTADNNNTAPKASSRGFHAKVHVRSGNQPPLLAGLCIDPLVSDSLTSAVNAASAASAARVAQTINIPP